MAASASSFHYDSSEMMRAIAKVCGMEWSPLQKMVLVLEVDSIPKLYTQGLVGQCGPGRQEFKEIGWPEVKKAYHSENMEEADQAIKAMRID